MFRRSASKLQAGLKPVRRIVALGDIHGDLAKAKTILRASNVVDKDFNFNATHNNLPTKLVQCGDLVHRGKDDIEVLDLFMHVRNSVGSGAAGEKKTVVLLLGNHEEMMAWGSPRYVAAAAHPGYAKAGGYADIECPTTRAQKFKDMFAPDQKYGKFLRSLDIAHLDAKTVFNHAGLHPQFVEDRPGTPQDRVAGVNAEAAAVWQRGEQFSRQHDTVLRDPVWNRNIYYNAVRRGKTVNLDATLKLLEADRMVVGHTPHQTVITAYAEGKLVGIDIAMSHGMRNTSPEALEILVAEDGSTVSMNAIRADGSVREVQVMPPSAPPQRGERPGDDNYE